MLFTPSVFFFVDLDDSLITTAAGERRKIIIRRANVLTGKHLPLRPATKMSFFPVILNEIDR